MPKKTAIQVLQFQMEISFLTFEKRKRNVTTNWRHEISLFRIKAILPIFSALSASNAREREKTESRLNEVT